MYENLRKTLLTHKLRIVPKLHGYDNLRKDMTAKNNDVVLCFVMEQIAQ